MNKLSKSLVVALCCVPLLAACGKTNDQAKQTSQSNSTTSKNKLNTSKAIVGQKSLTNVEAKMIKPMMVNVLNQYNELNASQKGHIALSKFFNNVSQGTYFPSAINNGNLQQSVTNVKINIPNQKNKVTYQIANHYIVEIFDNQMVIRPTHTVQSITGVSKKNQQVNSDQAEAMNTIYAKLINYRIRKELPKDELTGIRYIPLKILSSSNKNGMLTKMVLMNQQLALKNGDIKAQNVVMKLNYSTGHSINTKVKIGDKSTSFNTPKNQIKSGHLISFSLSDNDKTVNLLDNKLTSKALNVLAENSITALDNSNSRPKLSD